MTKIFVTFEVIGYHAWRTAPDQYAYLRNTHRHVFHFRVELKVDHNDRAVEMIEFKDIARHYVVCSYPAYDSVSPEPSVDFGGNSCEQIAANLCHTLKDKKYQPVRIEVSEDAENGAIYEP